MEKEGYKKVDIKVSGEETHRMTLCLETFVN